MSYALIIEIEGAATIVVPPEVLRAAGLRIGDKVELAPGNHQLVLRPAAGSARGEWIETVTEEVLQERRDAYQRLA